MRSFLYTVLFVACSLFASGQSIRHIGAAEGLNNPTVYSIVQDDWGFVWIGTRDGLYKYNEGWRCEMFDVEAAFLNAELGTPMYLKWPEMMKELKFISNEEEKKRQ